MIAIEVCEVANAIARAKPPWETPTSHSWCLSFPYCRIGGSCCYLTKTPHSSCQQRMAGRDLEEDPRMVHARKGHTAEVRFGRSGLAKVGPTKVGQGNPGIGQADLCEIDLREGRLQELDLDLREVGQGWLRLGHDHVWEDFLGQGHLWEPDLR
ncbi:hypothetical protein BDV96DRAFT_46864 [Lophiotrema nucula]|uniref:Uncharacterized protein n=1 Tax=Lophiotrema nucula TaxID=690887 RepID=A0A6A5ZC08_9PLEO|nr:hypothetical protein BDV96DRAFT_46864 [Lophiotrema nucula]